MRQRSEALDHTNVFLESILFSLRAAAVAVDRDFIILSWNEAAVEIWGLRADEVRGQNTLTPLLNNPQRAMNGVLLLMEPQLPQDDDTARHTASK